ncbi:MAG: hypothetical protein GY822_14925 [Deltaproteobacteria bacterium]|nr:hypothetical protein [Deltaproteobacteria bacterium]
MDWYRDDARLSEALTRMMFFEDFIQGARILEVGPPSQSLASFLLELGAKKVVCALEDESQVDPLRATIDVPAVDFRAIRRGQLPGDDGAFDLVLDFTLPAALARGDTFRLTDVSRVLDEDGFAIASLRNPDILGLPGLYGQLLKKADDVPYPERLTFRGFGELLQENFDNIDVYFQSVLLGCFFGSFDADPKEEGISPHTGLMGEEPEPASHYLFTFGNQVPEIEDISLVQLPLDGLLRVRTERDEAKTHLLTEQLAESERKNKEQQNATHKLAKAAEALREEHQALKEKTSLMESSLVEVKSAYRQEKEEANKGQGELAGELSAALLQIAQQERTLVDFGQRVPLLRNHVDELVAQLKERLEERDELMIILEQSQVAMVARDAQLAAVHNAFDDVKLDLEERNVTLQGAVSTSEQQRAAIDGWRTTLAASNDEIAELKEALQKSTVDLERLDLVAKQRLAMVAQELERTREAFAAHKQQALENKEAQQSVAEALQEAKQEQQRLNNEIDDERKRANEAESAWDESEERTETSAANENELQQALSADAGKRDLLVQELQEKSNLVDVLEASAEHHESQLQKLAQGVQDLVADREGLERSKEAAEKAVLRITQVAKEKEAELSSELDAAHKNLAMKEALFAELQEKSSEAQQHLVDGRSKDASQISSLQQERDELLKDLLSQKESGKGAKATLEQRSKELGKSRDAFSEVAAQRDTLQHVLAQRDREIIEIKGEIDLCYSEVERLEGEVAQGTAKQADLEDKNEKARKDFSQQKTEFESLSSQSGELNAKWQEAKQSFEEELSEHLLTRKALGDVTLSLEQMEAETKSVHEQWAESTEKLELAQEDVERLIRERQEAHLVKDQVLLLQETLAEAQQTLVQERARGDLNSQHLQEAQATLDDEKTRSTLFESQLREAQQQWSSERAATEQVLRAGQARIEEHASSLAAEKGNMSALQEEITTLCTEAAQAKVEFLSLEGAVREAQEARETLKGALAESEKAANENQEDWQAKEQNLVANVEQAEQACNSLASELAQERERTSSARDEWNQKLLQMADQRSESDRLLDEEKSAKSAALEEVGALSTELEETKERLGNEHQKLVNNLHEMEQSLLQTMGRYREEAEGQTKKLEEESFTFAEMAEQAEAEIARQHVLLADAQKERDAAQESMKFERAKQQEAALFLVAERDGLQKAYNGMHKRLQESEAQLDAKSASESDFENALASIRQERDANATALQDHVAEIQSLKQKLDDEQISTQQMELRSCTLEDKKIELEKISHKADDALEEMQKEVEEMRKDREARMGELEARTLALAASEENTRAAEETISRERAEHLQVEKNLRSALEEADVAQELNAKTTTLLEEQQKVTSEFHERLASVERERKAAEEHLRDQLEEQKKENTTLVEQATDAEILKQDAENFAKDAEAWATEKAGLQERLQSALDDSANFEKQKNALVLQLADAELADPADDEELARLAENQAKLEQELSSQREKSVEAEQSAIALQDQLEKKEDAFLEIKSAQANLEEEKAALQKEMQEMQDDREREELELKRAEISHEESSKATDDDDKWKGKMKALREALTQSELKTASMEWQMLQNQEQVSPNDDVQNLQKRLAAKEEEILDKAERINRLTERLVRLEN